MSKDDTIEDEISHVEFDTIHFKLKRLSMEEIIGIGLMIASCIVMGLGVFFRYVLNHSLSWTEELSRYGLIYITFIGTSTAIRHNSHIRIDVLDRLLGKKAKTALKMVNDAVTLMFLLFLVYISYQIIIALHTSKSTALQIPMSYLYVSGFIGFALASVRVVVQYLKKPIRISHGKEK